MHMLFIGEVSYVWAFCEGKWFLSIDVKLVGEVHIRRYIDLEK